MDNLSLKAEDGLSPLPLTETSRWTPELDNLIIDETNRFAHAAAAGVAEGDKRYNPIVLVGEVGVGKSHMLAGIRRGWRRNMPLQPVIYIKAESFCNDYIRATREKSMDKFRKHFRGTECLLFDELSFLEGKTGTQEEFFWTIDTILGKGGMIVCASNVSLVELKLQERILSRLKGGLTAWIDPLGEDTRRALLRRLLLQEKLDWPSAIQDLIVQYVNGDARGLIGVFETVAAHCHLLKEPVAEDLVRRVLNSYRGGEIAPRLSLETIERAVENYFGLLSSSSLLRSPCRSTGDISHARQLAMLLARNLIPGLSLSEIGSYFGRDHTTVTYACKKIERARKAEKGLVFRQYNDISSQLNSVK